LHTKIQITKQILTFLSQKRCGRFFKLSESGAGRKDGCSFSEGFEQRGGGTKKLVPCRGRKWSAEEQTVMEADDRRASVNGYGCEGEGRGGGRFVSWLRSNIQPLKDGGRMIVMVEMGRKKITSRLSVQWCVRASALASSFVDFEKTPKTFFRLGASS
jgi:hypothetical protein